MLMGNSVEGRFPYLDYRVAEFAARFRTRTGCSGSARSTSRKAVADVVPDAIRLRGKQPYRAPIARPSPERPPPYLGELLSPARLEREACSTRRTSRGCARRPPAGATSDRDGGDGARRRRLDDAPPRAVRGLDPPPARRALEGRRGRQVTGRRGRRPRERPARVAGRRHAAARAAAAAASPRSSPPATRTTTRRCSTGRFGSPGRCRTSASAAEAASSSSCRTRGECAVAVYGVALAGGVFVVVHPQTKSQKLEYILGDSGAEILVVHERAPRVRRDRRRPPVAPSRPRRRGAAGLPPGSLRLGARRGLRAPAARPRDPRGSRRAHLHVGEHGNPKGVMMRHRTWSSRCRASAEYLRLSPADRILNVLPLAFDYGLYQLLMSVRLGATLVLEQSFAFPREIVARAGRGASPSSPACRRCSRR